MPPKSVQRFFAESRRGKSKTSLRQRLRLAAALLAVPFFVPTSLAFAEDAEWHPKPCIGYYPDRDGWGAIESGVGTKGYDSDHCPEGWALFTAERTSGTDRAGEWVHLTGICCELPPNALTGERVKVPSECPDGYVITGVATEIPLRHDNVPRDDMLHPVYCQRLDPGRFRLGPPLRGYEVSTGVDFLRDGIAQLKRTPVRRIPWSRVPAGFRYGVGRTSQRLWWMLSCVSQPWGAIVTGKRGKACSSMQFRQLLSASTDEPVQLIPDCESIRDPASPNATCIPYPAAAMALPNSDAAATGSENPQRMNPSLID